MVIRHAFSPRFPIEGIMHPEHWVLTDDWPIGTEDERGTRFSKVSPGKTKRPALLPHPELPDITIVHRGWGMQRLHRGDHPQLFEARQVIWMDDFNMLHPVAAIPHPLGFLCHGSVLQ